MLKALFSLLFVTFIWGATFPLQKIALVGVSPTFYIAIRFIIASALSYLLFGKGSFRYGVILGAVLGVAYTTQTWGLTLTTSTKSGFITSLYIVFVPIFAYFIEKEVPTLSQIVSFFVGSMGLYMISGRIDELNLGDLLTVFCAVGFALHVVLITRFSKRVDEKDLLFPQFLVVAIFNLILSLFFRNWRFNFFAFGSALFTAAFATMLAIYLQAKYQKVLGNNISALVFLGEPVFAAILSYLVLKETLSPRQLTGSFFLLASILLSSLERVRIVRSTNQRGRDEREGTF
ncbi:DMT family transporter [Thermotoga sp.]|uniref:DMT family transporter n=1 Tax=Thermotoga sp. TaxID=28240 RepID=UPI0025FD8DD3|nr:DMT family transporter [Thermotoga sp.]MCD6551649.1 DMT family transporter [Thermotoga sp.]